MKKNIFIIRHGQSEANANVRGLLSKEGEYVIDSAFDITDLGKKQVEKTADEIFDMLFFKLAQPPERHCTIITSPYTRTRSTANVLEETLKGRGMFVVKKLEDPRLVEQDFGDFDFQHRSKWKKISPHSFEVNQAKYHDPTGRFFARLENGENLLDVYNRISLFVTTRLEREMHHTGIQNFIIVTHGNTMRILKMFLEDLPIECFNSIELPDNAGGYHFTYEKYTGEYKYMGTF